MGFSVHGTLETTKRFLAVYGKHMEFCQIQLNWLDWKLQNAKAKVELLNELRIPIWVMEPLRGGSLVSLSPEHEAILRERDPKRSLVEWSFRYLQSVPGVTVTLSGMSNFTQLKENIATFETEQALSEEDIQVLYDIAKAMTAKDTLPCTACRYCTEYCPMELDIPSLIDLYNEHTYSKGGFLAPMAINALPENKRPSACLGCRACEAVCPQGIKISEMMTDFVRKLNI